MRKNKRTLEIDPSIEPYLNAEINTAYERENENDDFQYREDFIFGHEEE